MKLRHRFTSSPAILTIISLTLGFTAIPSHAETDWEAKYKEICSYDGMCGKLKAGSDWTAPAANIVDVLRSSRPLILAAAKLYGVDPRAIAGCILTENSLNLPLKHQAELWFAMFKKNSDHTLFGKRFGTGLGQLHDDIAYDVEPRAAAMEKRPRLTELSKVHERMETIEGSIYYVAAILKDAQDIYRKYGFDITKDIGLQATLYNLGQYDMRAKDTKNNKRQPRINHFGFFVQHNEPLLASIVGMNAGAPSSAMILGVEPPQAPAAKTTATNGKASNGAARAVELTAKSKPKAKVLKEPLDVANLPDLCDQSNAKKKIGTLPKDIPYRVIAQDVDCGLGKWSLVSGADGTVGWVKDSVLQAKSSESTSYTDCKVEIDAPCSKSIKSTNDSSLHAEKGGLLTYHLKKITDCNAADNDDNDDDGSADNAPGTPGLKDLLSSDEKVSLQTAYNNWVNKIQVLPNSGRDNPQIKRILDALSKTPTYGAGLRYIRSYGLTFITKSNYQKLLGFFSNPISSEMTEETSKDIEKAIGDTAVFGSYAEQFFTRAIQACSTVPDDYQQTTRFLRDYTLDLMSRFTQSSYSITTPYIKAAENLKSFCTREFPASTSTAPVSSSASSSSVTGTGTCPRPPETGSSDLSKTIQEAQTACAKLSLSDQELFKRAKTYLKSVTEEKLAEVRECGFDLKDASKSLKKLNATGCVKDIYVDSATSFEYLATQKINTIYKPASADGQFILTPKQNNSCATGGKAQ